MKNLFRKCVDESYLDFSVRNKLIDTEPQFINLEKTVGSTVKLCVANPQDTYKNDVDGVITKITGDDYTVEIPNPPKGINRVIKMNKADKTVNVKRSDLMNVDGSLRECYHWCCYFQIPTRSLR